MPAKIYYSKPEMIRDLMMGLKFIQKYQPELYAKLKAHDLKDTHQLVALYPMHENERLDNLFAYYQAEEWSPNGEAKELIIALGLNHTSMSVGDIIEYSGRFYFCDVDEWTEL